MKKIFSILLICAAAVAIMTPADAQGRRSRASRSAAPAADAAGAEEAAPKTGVRFVVCSPGGASMPSRLYVQSGKTYKAIQMGSRTPSVRVKPIGGVVKFWKEDPQPTAGMNTSAAAAATKLPPPALTINVPNNISSKTLCILSPNEDLKKTASLFLNEADFPRSGMHVINLSAYPLLITVASKADFSDKKDSKVGVFRKEDGICGKNSWSFKGEKGQQVSFILSYLDKASKEPKRLKASTFVVSGRQSIINLVVKDPKLNRPKLMAVQLSDDKKDAEK